MSFLKNIMHSFLVPFGVALILSYVLTPLVIFGAQRAGAFDVPSDDRRSHALPIPRLGGIAVIGAISLTWLGLSIVFGKLWNPLAPHFSTVFLGIALGAGMIFIAGLFDDVRGLSPRLKLIIQVGAALVVVAYGFSPRTVAFIPNTIAWHAGEVIGGGMLIFWIVGITNAFNLIDGLDGLASSFALMVSGVVLLSSLVFEGGLSPALPTIITGAIVGFLRYNWSPARIFLGDAGSMTLGFLFAVLTVIAATDASGVTYPIIPLFALAFPITDTLVSMARRWLRGVPFSLADRRHIHHQLRGIGLSVPQTVKVLVATFGGIATIGLVILFAPPRFKLYVFVCGISIAIALVLYGLRWLQYEEFMQLGASLRSTLRHARQVVRLKIYANEAAVRIARAKTAGEIREIFDTLATQVGLLDIELIEPGQKERATPTRQQITPVDAFPMRLDYTFVLRQSASHRIVIRLWDRPDPGKRPHTMERIIAKIGRATADWYGANGEALKAAGMTKAALINNT